MLANLAWPGFSGLRIRDLGHDFLASIVVFLVALPLCLGIAVASGAPPALGLITGIVGGLVVGVLAGSPLQVSGPAAGLAVLVFELLGKHGLVMLGVVVFMAGALQLLAGSLKLGQWFRAISPSVVHGMLAGIGALIFLSQFHVMIDDSPHGSGIDNMLAIPAAIAKVFVGADGSVHHLAAVVGLATMVTIVLWGRIKHKTAKLVPAPLVAITVGSILAWMLDLPIQRVDVPDDLLGTFNIPTRDALAQIADPDIIGMALVFAFVASAETLLCATAVDQLHTGPRTRYDQELRAQGIGNMICGVFGALPMTGVIVRSSANVQAGATSRWSAILHGLWLLAAVVAFSWLLSEIPTAALAAILVYTGFKLVSVGRIKAIAGYGKIEIAIYAATFLGVVSFNLLTGVLVGFALATAKLVYTFTHLRIDKIEDAAANDGQGRVEIDLRGSATFYSIPQLAGALEGVPEGSEVHLHIEHLGHVDHACLDMLQSWAKQYEATGGRVVLGWRELESRYLAPRESPLPMPKPVSIRGRAAGRIEPDPLWG